MVARLDLRARAVWMAKVSLTALFAAACGSQGPGADAETPSLGSGGGMAAGGPSAGAASGAGGSAPGAGGRAGNGGSTPSQPDGIVPLFDENTELEPALVEDRPDARVTRLSDRARDRHARETEFQAYEHYLHLYWEYRTAEIEIIDTIGKGGDSITFNVVTQWKLDDNQAELRFFFRGIGTVAEYHDNQPMDPVGNDGLHYTRTVTTKMPENRPLQVGDKMEFELSQFLDKDFNGQVLTGRDNYYGTTMLYIVGKGIVPWIGSGELRDSNPVPESAWLGGHTSVHVNESNEPDHLFLQMAGNLAPQNGQRFVLGRRAIHTHFDDGHHDESPENPPWSEQAGKLGPLYINRSCNQCHSRNGRAVPPAVGATLDQYVFKVGDEEGNPDPRLGSVLQPADGSGEPAVTLSGWSEEGGLRKPEFAFDGEPPEAFSPRIAPALVGLGLLEAIPESAIARLADPEDSDGDGISGRVRVVVDPVTDDPRLGRFGWKAGQATVKQQVAAALRTDMGVLTSVFPAPDCGAAQVDCGDATPELGDSELDDLSLYVSLLGMRPQRDWDDPEVVKGKALFTSTGCAKCHTPELATSEFAHFAELRGQTIRPYTDLLLHDMGEGLADTLPEGDASYLEWRTPPLWGIGLTAGVSGEESFLHDGRARSLTEAILWHGGEGEASRSAFEALPGADQAALLTFLRSL